ncbi:UrcA family protein [Phenylobacterium sp.]|uniref:UrcA family protein n=1 Tax=Phenylobacterium sp. TaxID=1871053 RepID=UPI0035AEA946
MTNFASRIAGVATLALAALPFAAISTAAAAAPVAVKVADLDLNSAQGLATFEARAEKAANAYCAANGLGARPVGDVAACRAAVRQEIQDKLPAVQQAQVARATTYAAR